MREAQFYRIQMGGGVAQLPPPTWCQGWELWAEPAWPYRQPLRGSARGPEQLEPLGTNCPSSPRRNHPILRLPQLVLKTLRSGTYRSYNSSILDQTGLQKGDCSQVRGGPQQDGDSPSTL